MKSPTTPVAAPPQVAVYVTLPVTAPQTPTSRLRIVAAVAAALVTADLPGVDTQDIGVQEASTPPVSALPVIGPSQIQWVDQALRLAIVSYPVGQSTVMSVQPDGRVETRPADTRGPFELTYVGPDRCVFNPLGPTGPTFVLPYQPTVPNNA